MNLAPVLKQRFFDSNGVPLAGGQLFSYAAGTSTPQVTYSNQSGTTNTNPVILDSNGYANVWLDPTLAYKFVLEDASNNVIFTEDNVTVAPLGMGIWNANTVYQQGNIVADSSGQGLLYVSLTNNNQNNALTNVSSWRKFGGNTRTVTVNTTLLVSDEYVRSNSTSGNLLHTLPACSSTPIGYEATIEDVGTGGFYTQVKGSGTDQIQGNNTYGINIVQNGVATFRNNGSSYDVKGALTLKSITQTMMAPRATGSTVAAGGVAISSSSGAFTTNSGTPTAVTNLSVTITTTGRPVKLGLISDGSGNNSGMLAPNNQIVAIYFLNGSTVIGQQDINLGAISGTPNITIPCNLWHIDTPSASTITYSVQASTTSGTMGISYVKLIVYEL